VARAEGPGAEAARGGGAAVLECGRLCYGFVHLECEDCRAPTHVLVPEAGWDATGEVTLPPPPSDDEVEQVLLRVVRQVRGAFAKVEGCEWLDEDEESSRLQAEAVHGRLALDVDAAARTRRRRVAVACGFSLHANTWVHANDREGLARLGRYGARGPLAEERLTRLEDGCVGGACGRPGAEA